LRQKQKQIGSRTYTATEFDPWTQLGLKARVVAMFGPALARAAAAGSEKILTQDIQAFVPSIDALAAAAGGRPAEFQQLCLDMCRNVVVREQGKEASAEIQDADQFNAAFAGRLGELYPVLHLVLEANDFFGIGGILTQLGKTSPQKPPAG
jgi:hypothetical protein